MAKKKQSGMARPKKRKPMTEPELLERLKEVGGSKLVKFAQEVLKEAPDHDLTIVWRDAGPMLKYVHDGGLDQAINFGQLSAKGVLRQGKKPGQPAAVVREYWKMVAQLIPGARLKKFTKPSGQTVEALVVGEKPRRRDSPPLSELATRKDEWFGIIDAAIANLGQTPNIFPDEVAAAGRYVEGSVRQVAVNAYERSSTARRACLDHYGLDCAVCGFNFAEVYGTLGKGFIHVHHLRDLAVIGEEYEVDPIGDLRPVCPNCHAMLHRKTPAMGVDALREKMQARAESDSA